MTLDSRCAGSATACIVAALLSAGIGAVEERPGDDESNINVTINEQPYRLALAKRTGQRPSNVMFVRWSRGQPRESDAFLPLPADHPAHDEECLWCQEPLGNGQPVQLLVLGATTKRDRIAHDSGFEYSAMAVYGHAVCISGEPSPCESTYPNFDLRGSETDR